MATQFIIRSEGGTKALSLKTVVYDGLKIGRLEENGISIFEIPSDPDVIIELVVKRKSISATAVSSIPSGTGSKASPTSEPSKKREAPAFTPDDILMKRYSAEEIASVFSKKKRLLDKDEKWQEQYDKLVVFKQHNGHCRVPYRYENDPYLGSWVKNQRDQYKRGNMIQARVDLLNAIGFTWSVRDESLTTVNANGQAEFKKDKWHDQYDKLVAFKEANGHCRVPYRYKKDPYLGSWVKNQRDQYKRGNRIKARVDLLNAIGFTWSVRDESPTTADADGQAAQVKEVKWHDQYDKLVAFKEANGHCRVPYRYENDSYLGLWVKYQREQYKRGKMIEARIDLLNAIGFTWSVRDESQRTEVADGHAADKDEKWRDQYDKLVAFKEANGHCRVPYRYDNDPYLGLWVKYQREQYKRGKMIEARIDLLNAIGFTWSVRVELLNG